MEILIDSVKPEDLILLVNKAFEDGCDQLVIRKCADCGVLLVFEYDTPDVDGASYCREC